MQANLFITLPKETLHPSNFNDIITTAITLKIAICLNLRFSLIINTINMQRPFLKYTCLLFTTLLFGMTADAQMKEDIKKEIDKIIYYDTEIPNKKIAGYSIGLIYGDSVFIYQNGAVDFQSNEKIQDSTVFELGGLSKVFTASLIEVLVLEGFLDYQSPFNEYLDSTFRNKNMADLSIEDLVTHRSGLPKLPYEFGIKEKEANNPYAHYTKEDLLSFYKDYTVDEEANQEYFYSSINFALLEIAIEKSTGRAYEDLLQEKILTPLKMDDSFVHSSQKPDKTPSPGFSISGNLVPVLKFQSFAASEGVKSSMNDLVKFVMANMDENSFELSTAFKNIHQPMGDIKLNKETKIAKGWHVLKPKKYYDVILHSGSTNGHRAFIGFVKETNTGVIVLANSEHREDGLGFLILRMLNHDWKKKGKKRKKGGKG